MLLKCCTQYANKFEKLSSGHRTGKGQFSFQSQRRIMPKNVQTTAQLHSFHMLARLCSKSFKTGFNNTWTENFQMYKLDLEKAEEPEIKLPTSAIAIAKSLQSCPTLCDPIDSSPPGFPVPGILQARTLEWVAISFSNARKWKVKVKSLISVWPSTTPWTAAFQAPPSMGFSRQEYWSGVPLPSPFTQLTYLKMVIQWIPPSRDC